MPVNQASVVCGFCKRGTNASDICGPLHKCQLKNGSVCAAHLRCMQYSIYLGQYKFKKFGGFKVDEVRKEITRARSIKCFLCKKSTRGSGASSRCGFGYCPRTFHYYCARTNDKCFTRRVCIRRRKSSRRVILYRAFCSKEHERKTLRAGYLFQEAFHGEDSSDDDCDDSSGGESENDFELYEDEFLKQKAEKLAARTPRKKMKLSEDKTPSRAERLELREKPMEAGGQEKISRRKMNKLRKLLRTTQNNMDDKTVGKSLENDKIDMVNKIDDKLVMDTEIKEKLLQQNGNIMDAVKEKFKTELCLRSNRHSNCQKEITNTKIVKKRSICDSKKLKNCKNFSKIKCSKSECQNLNSLPKILNNRILSVTLEKLSDSVLKQNDLSKTVTENGHCLQSPSRRHSERTIHSSRLKKNNCKCCEISLKEISEKSPGKRKYKKRQSVVKISGSCQKMVKEVRKGLFGDPVGALIQICLKKLPLDLCLQGSVNLVDKKSSILPGHQQQPQSQTNLTLQESPVKTDSSSNNREQPSPKKLIQPSPKKQMQLSPKKQMQDMGSQADLSDEEYSEESLPDVENIMFVGPESFVKDFSEHSHLADGPINLQVENLSVDLNEPSSPDTPSPKEQETMVLCICRHKKADLQSQSRILKICKNRYQASKMNVFFWHDIMPSSFKPEYLPYFFLDIVECLRLKMYEVFFTLLFKFDQKHSEKFQYLIDIEDDSVIKEQADKIWTTVASYLKKASLDSGKEVGILMNIDDEQEVMLLPINEVNDKDCKIRRQLIHVRSQSQVMGSSIQDVTQEAYTLKSWLQVNLQDCYQVFYKPDDDVINISDMETSCTNQLYVYLKQHALNTSAGNGVSFGKHTIIEISDKIDYVLCIGSVDTDIVNYLNYCEKALFQFITKLEDRCTTIYCILDIGEARGISQAFQILPKNEIWQGQVEVFSAVVPGTKLNFCVILKIVPSRKICDAGNISQTEKSKKRLGDISAIERDKN